jgi:hypothetical protein
MSSSKTSEKMTSLLSSLETARDIFSTNACRHRNQRRAYSPPQWKANRLLRMMGRPLSRSTVLSDSSLFLQIASSPESRSSVLSDSSLFLQKSAIVSPFEPSRTESLTAPGIYSEVLSNRTILAIRRIGIHTWYLRKRLAICLVSRQVHRESYSFRFKACTLELNTVSDLKGIPAICRQEALRIVYSAYISTDYRVFGGDFPRFTGLMDVTLKHPRCVTVPAASLVTANPIPSIHEAIIVAAVQDSIIDEARQHLLKVNDRPGNLEEILPGGEFEPVLRERFGDAAVSLEVTVRSHWFEVSVRRVSVHDRARSQD